MDFFCCFALGLLPLLGAKGIERCGFLIRAAVPANQVERRDRDVEFGLIGIFESQEFGGLPSVEKSANLDIDSRHAQDAQWDHPRAIPLAFDDELGIALIAFASSSLSHSV